MQVLLTIRLVFFHNTLDGVVTKCCSGTLLLLFWLQVVQKSVPYTTLPYPSDRLVGLVVKTSASRAQDPGFESRVRREFFGVESYQ